MPEQTDIDAKQELDSSSVQPGDTSTSPVETTDAKDPTSVEAILAEAAPKDGSDSSLEGSDVAQTLQPEKAKPAAAKEEPGKEQKPEELKPQPFHKHPDWIKREEKLKAVEGELTKLKESGKVWEDTKAWLQQNQLNESDYQTALKGYAEVRLAGVAPEQIAQTLQWRALVQTDPHKALEMAEQEIEGLRIAVGAALPGDLQAAVDANEITVDWAKKLAQQRFEAQGHKRVVENQTQLNQQNQERLAKTALNDWIMSKQTTDPAFKPSEPGKRGMFEAVTSVFQQLTAEKIDQVKRPLRAEELVTLAEQAYLAEVQYRQSLIPTPPARKAPLSGSSRTGHELAPKWDSNDDIIEAAMSANAGRA